MPFPVGSGAADPPTRTAAGSACAPGRDVFQYDCYDSMNPVLLPEKQGTTILLQLHVSIQQNGERLLYRSPLFALILSAVYPFAAEWISDIPTASCSPPSWQFWKTPAPMYGSRQAPADGTPHRGSRMPASPAPARWLRLNVFSAKDSIEPFSFSFVLQFFRRFKRI